jgi:predicted anti-sigma-YlaC factor YlaD
MEHETCHQLLSSLSDYIDHNLSAELCTQIERHMQDCENCRIVIDTLSKTVELYHVTAPNPDVPHDVQVRLFHRLELDDFLPK